MKHIILMRHAKSSWNDTHISDHERSLNDRGIADAPLMAEQIKLHGLLPDAVYSSDSERTKATLKLFQTRLSVKNIFFTPTLYLASDREILRAINQADDSYNCILLLAHNPGITDAFKLLANINIDNVPTSGAGCIRFDVRSFSDIKEKTGSLDYFIYPKLYATR